MKSLAVSRLTWNFAYLPWPPFLRWCGCNPGLKLGQISTYSVSEAEKGRRGFEISGPGVEPSPRARTGDSARYHAGGSGSRCAKRGSDGIDQPSVVGRGVLSCFSL